MKNLNVLLVFIFIAISIFLLLVPIKGAKGDPFIYFQKENEKGGVVGGPFESSGSTSRYALIQAIVDRKTLFFDEEFARFAAPDFVEYRGKFFSIFTPGVSFIGIPFYILGKNLNLPQLVTFFSTSIFALINALLIILLSRKLGANLSSGVLCAFLFLFATNSFVYSGTLTQHHFSVTFILLGLLNIFWQRNILSNVALGAIIGAGLLIDIPNVILMFPLVLYIVFKHIVPKTSLMKLSLSIKLNILGLLMGLIPIVSLFAWYNHQLTGSYTKIGQTIGRSDFFEPEEEKLKNKEGREKLTRFEKKLAFDTRNQMSDLFILTVSNQRGLIYYSPIVLLGVIGLFKVYFDKSKRRYALIASAVILVNVVTYSMFSALGGWAFGPRYLIPASAILCVFLAIAVQNFRKNLLFILSFILLTMYSLGVNVLGAVTTTQIPPRIEAINLPKPIPYTYEYNRQLAFDKNFSGSLLYNVYLSEKISVKTYIFIVFSITLTFVLANYLLIIFRRESQ